MQSDSFRTLLEQVLEDMLVGGFGAVEMELTGDRRAASSRCGRWTARRSGSIRNGRAAIEVPRYAQANWAAEPDECGPSR